MERLTAASQAPSRVIVRLDDLAVVLHLVRTLDEEREVLRQMINRDRRSIG